MKYLDMIAQLLPQGQSGTPESYELAQIALKAKKLEDRISDTEKQLKNMEKELKQSKR